ALYYFDASGFALDPTIPYAWQEPNSIIELPARKSGRINVLGFMNRQNDLHPFMFEGSIHTGVVIACFDTFCQTLTKKTVVVIDNASIHTSEEFGVPGATAGKCAVSPLAQNITFLPGVWRVRNAWKINTCLKAHVRGFLATLG